MDAARQMTTALGLELVPTNAVQLRREGRSVPLTEHEGFVFRQMAEAYPGPVSGAEIRARLYPQRYGPSGNIVSVWMNRIERKVEPLGLRIVRDRRGYRLAEDRKA